MQVFLFLFVIFWMDLEGIFLYLIQQASDLHLNLFSEILKLNMNDLQKWLIHKQIESMSETVLIPINLQNAEAARDA